MTPGWDHWIISRNGDGAGPGGRGPGADNAVAVDHVRVIFIVPEPHDEGVSGSHRSATRVRSLARYQDRDLGVFP